MDLAIDLRIEDQLAFVTVVGEVDVYTSPRLREVLTDLYLNAPPKVCAIDLTQVDYLDSTGMGVLVGGLKRARDRHGELVLILRQNQPLMKSFRINGLTMVFPIYESGDEVRAAKNWVNWDRGTDVVIDQDEVVIGFPVWLDVKDGKLSRALLNYFDELLSTFDLEVIFRSRDGREFGVRRRSGSPSASASEQSARLRSAIEGHHAGLTTAQRRALSGFLEAIHQAKGAVIQIASLMLVKFDGETEIRNLTQPELRYWYQNEHLKTRPELAMLVLRSPPSPLAMKHLGHNRSPRLKAIAEETVEILDRGWYTDPAGRRVELADRLDQGQRYVWAASRRF